MRFPTLKSTLIFASGFATCLLCLVAIAFGGYYFLLKPEISDAEKTMSTILEAPSIPAPRPADFNFSIVDASSAANGNFKRIALQSYRGRVVVLNFWATWCPPCQAELPSLGKLAKHYAGQPDVAVLCVSEELPAVISKNKNAVDSGAPLYSLNGQRTPQTYTTEAIPATFIIGTNGMIVFKDVGAADWSDQSVIKFIDSLKGKFSTANNSASAAENNSKPLSH